MTANAPSPLGRHDRGHSGSMHNIHLAAVPVRVLAAGRQHHDELMREFAILALSEDQSLHAVPRQLTALIDDLGSRYAGATQRPDEAIDAALAAGVDTVDLSYQVPSSIVADADRLEQLLAEADEFCRTKQLLTLPRSDVNVTFAHWYLDEFRRQVGGERPRAWTGPIDD